MAQCCTAQRPVVHNFSRCKWNCAGTTRHRKPCAPPPNCACRAPSEHAMARPLTTPSHSPRTRVHRNSIRKHVDSWTPSATDARLGPAPRASTGSSLRGPDPSGLHCISRVTPSLNGKPLQHAGALAPALTPPAARGDVSSVAAPLSRAGPVLTPSAAETTPSRRSLGCSGVPASRPQQLLQRHVLVSPRVLQRPHHRRALEAHLHQLPDLR